MSLIENEQSEPKKQVPTKQKPKEIAQENAKRTQLVYCGPNLKGGVLTRYTVFRGSGLPKHLDKHIDSCPAISRLFVAPKFLTKTDQAIKTTGTPQNVWFKEIQAYVQGGVN